MIPEDLRDVAAQLRDQRPEPDREFVHRSYHHLKDQAGVPRRSALWVGACAGGGTLLLALGALGVLGVGPLAL